VRFAVALLALTGCRQILGLDDTGSIDAMIPQDSTDFDTPPDGVAADPKCFGSGNFGFCLAATPTGSMSLMTQQPIDTTACSTGMKVAIGARTTCVIAANSISLPSANNVRVTGNVPLVLAATSSISILGTLDVSSNATSSGPNANAVECGIAGTSGSSNVNGGGGGAGGSFGTKGGEGGDGAALGGTASPALAVSNTLHGGCRGGTGGAGSGAATTGGAGGGAVYLVTHGAMSISGTINASGAGGNGGSVTKGGGSGGASGGMIVLLAGQITGASTARIVANGGGGGGGATNNNPGEDGEAPDPAQVTNRAGGGGPVSGGQGGVVGSTGGNGNNSANGGGGGGGGVGQIRILGGGNPFQSNQISPTPTP
jgi:hypothetical protein